MLCQGGTELNSEKKKNTYIYHKTSLKFVFVLPNILIAANRKSELHEKYKVLTRN